MKISFCVTYYNQEKFVKKSLDSILSLDIPCDFEILVGDDGSADGTIEEVKHYQEKHPDKIKLFQMPREQGIKYDSRHRVGENRLNLARNAMGDFIMFLDGDDYYIDGSFIKESLKAFEENRDIVACAFDFKYIFSDREEIRTQYLREGVNLSKEYIAKGHWIHAGAIVFKNNKKYFDEEKISILEKSTSFSDNGITIYMLQFGNLYYIPTPIYAYTQNEDSIWNSVTQIEQYLVNAYYYEMISRTAPKFRQEILCRHLGAIKETYKNRKKLKRELGDLKYQEYLNKSKEANNEIIVKLLEWDKLSFIDKIKFKLWLKAQKNACKKYKYL